MSEENDDIDITTEEEKTSIVSNAEPEPKKDQASDKMRTPAGQPWFEIAPHAGEWYWVLWSENGRPLAIGGRGYATKNKAREAIDNVVKTASPAVKIVIAYEAGKKNADEPT
jgi:uncharacterized protein YegP (UPF0339 family)